jgi:hypothetical protein
MLSLMASAQRNYFKLQMRKRGLGPAELAREFELSQSIQSEEELLGAPLAAEELGKL